MQNRRSTYLIGTVCLSTLLAAGPAPRGPSGVDSRQIWKGMFQQTAPMPWSGPIELYLRYDSESPPPQKVDGVLSWPSLGKARVRINGERAADGTVRFTETSCLDGDCSQVVLGGSHRLTPNRSQAGYDGLAEGRFGLKGSYRLVP